jgi:hypothetical protein
MKIPRKRINVYIPEDDYELFKADAKARCIPMSVYFLISAHEYMKMHAIDFLEDEKQRLEIEVDQLNARIDNLKKIKK